MSGAPVDVATLIAVTEQDLARRFPQVDRVLLEARVRAAFAQLMPAAVQTYLPLLVAHQVRDEITRGGGRGLGPV